MSEVRNGKIKDVSHFAREIFGLRAVFFCTGFVELG